MSSQTVSRRIRLRNGTEFNVTFHRRSATLVVVEAESRRPMRVEKVLDGIYAGAWSARVVGTGFTALNANPAKAFDIAARRCWRESALQISEC